MVHNINNVNNKVEVTSSKLGKKPVNSAAKPKESLFNKTSGAKQSHIVTGKLKNAKGGFEKRSFVKLKSLENGRSLVADQNGKQWVMAHDGIILKASYVEGKQTPKNQGKAAPDKKGLETANFLAREFNSAQKSFNAQMKKDGWAGDLADGISRAWTWATDSKNSANYVRDDLKAQKKNVQDLQNAAKQGQAQFNAKFKEIYGVNYNQQAMDKYMAEPTEENYKKAFGTKTKNIKTRVDKYNQSQDTGAIAVKTTTKVAAGVAIGVTTGGTGLVALGAAAAATAATSVIVEETDALKVTDAVTKGKVEFREGADHKKILKDAAWDGASVLAGGAVGKVAGTVIKGTGKMAVAGRAAMNITGDVAVGAAQEYTETGKITAAGVATNAVMSGVGSAVTSGVLNKGFKAVKKGFGNVADNVSQKFSAKKSSMPKTMFDADGMPLAGGGKSESIGLLGKLKAKMGLGSTKIAPDIKAKLKSNYMNDIIERVETTNSTVVSRRLEDALNGKPNVIDLPSGTNLRDISRHVPDGEICTIGAGKNQKLYINDNGNPVELKISREKFEELFPPLGTATFYQPGHQVCTIQANINSMLESAGGRVQLFSMFEQKGDDIIINLRGGKAPVKFSGGKPVNINLKEHNANIFGGDAQGLEMLQQALLVDRVRTAANTPDVVNVTDLSAKALVKQANTQVNDHVSALPLLGNNPQSGFNKKSKLEMIEQRFVPGQDIMTFTNGGHQRSVVDYDPSTKIVTYHDPHHSGVNEQMPLEDFVDYAEFTFLNKRPKNAAPVPDAPPKLQAEVSTMQTTPPEQQSKIQIDISAPSKQAETNTQTRMGNFISTTTELTNHPAIVAHTADGSPIRASVTQRNVVIVKNGKYIPIEIPKSGTIEPILEKSTDTFLIIKNDNGKVSIVTSESPDLPNVSSATSKVATPVKSQSTPVYKENSSNTVSAKPKTASKPSLEIPAGAKLIDTVTIMGKQCRRIKMPNGEFLTEFGGKWKKL